MIQLGELTAVAESDGVDAMVVERDYVIHHVMASIGRTRAAEQLQFKGGTAIRLCHERDYRYSADIDLNVVSGTRDSAVASIRDALEDCLARVGFSHLVLAPDGKGISYVGPTRRPRNFKVDIDDAEFIADVGNREHIITRYSDEVEGVELKVYNRAEILAEKFRCVMQRLQCRDLYDIWFLTLNGHAVASDAGSIFPGKARQKGLDPETFCTRFRVREEQYRERWANELSPYLADPPDVRRVLRDVKRALRQAGLLP